MAAALVHKLRFKCSLPPTLDLSDSSRQSSRPVFLLLRPRLGSLPNLILPQHLDLLKGRHTLRLHELVLGSNVENFQGI